MAEIRSADVLKLRDDLAGEHSAANETLASLSAMFPWSIPREWRDINPCKGVTRIAKGDAFAAWPDDKVALLTAHAPRPIYWATMVALYTGQRRGDVLRMMWSDIDQQGLILVRQSKTEKRLWIPIHTRLREILAEIPRKSTHILTSALGRPWQEFGFSTAWQRTLEHKELAAIREEGLVVHGLRKSAAVKLAEAGCTDAEIAAITGQTRQMVEHKGRRPEASCNCRHAQVGGGRSIGMKDERLRPEFAKHWAKIAKQRRLLTEGEQKDRQELLASSEPYR